MAKPIYDCKKYFTKFANHLIIKQLINVTTKDFFGNVVNYIAWRKQHKRRHIHQT